MKVHVAIAVVACVVAGTTTAQTRSVRDTATAYGARLNARGLPATLNPSRVNSRIDRRIDSRLALRIERYRPDSTGNPTAAFAAPQDDKSRNAPIAAPPPPQVDEPQ